MKKLTAVLVSSALLALVTLETGCLTSKQAVVNPTTGQTNYVTQVNQLYLAADCEVIKIAAAGATTVALQKTHGSTNVFQALMDAHLVLDGARNGLNTNTQAIVVEKLSGLNNQSLSSEILSFSAFIDKERADLLTKYGSEAALQIVEAITAAVDQGIEMGLGISN